jgi:ABC-type sulfate/molybdate transport systems ATPase subunit
MGAEICSVRNLQVVRSGRLVLDNLSLELTRGEPFAIVGRSGSGKTTLLAAMTGLLKPDSGSVLFGSREVGELSFAERASRFGLVFQDYQLFPHLSVIENLLLAPRVRGLPHGREKALALLEDLGVASLAERIPGQMSGGQKQRVAIARSLLLEPQVLFLDEPSAALDEKTTFELADLLSSLNHKSQIVAVSHDRPFLSRFVKRGIRLEGGGIAASGALTDLFSGD